MKNKIFFFGLLIITIVSFISPFSQQPEPWTPDQLMSASDLAARINHTSDPQPLIICVGPSGLIKGSLETGPAQEKENLEKLRVLLSKIDSQKEVVIYCGCCPFEHCPNIRPAFTLLSAMHFSHARLLDLSHNIKVDWIDKGYPVKDTK
jgi:thiosulfate/3-mercaptopyruvate sulfurtransferase